MSQNLRDTLTTFATDHNFTTRGRVCLALHLTRLALETGLPLEAATLVRNSGGHIVGLNKKRIQSILASHDEWNLLSAAGGRTSRGHLPHLHAYCRFLNKFAPLERSSLRAIESWWVEQAKAHIEAGSFQLRYKPCETYASIVENLLQQAGKLQLRNPATPYQDILIHHLVGASLEISLAHSKVILEHHRVSQSDVEAARQGSFQINSSVIHVASVPAQALFETCQRNLDAGLTPLVITLFARMEFAQYNAELLAIRERVEILPLEHFLATNLFGWSQFESAARHTSLLKLVQAYNAIIDRIERDPTLRIRFIG